MEISINSFLNPIKINSVKNRQGINFCGLKHDVFEKSTSNNQDFEKNLKLFIERLSEDDEASAKEIEEKINGFDEIHKQRLYKLINNPDVVDRLERDDSDFFAQTIMATGGYLEDNRYAKIEPFLNAGKLNVGKTLEYIVEWTRIPDEDFRKIQEYLNIDGVINLINEDKLDAYNLKYIARIKPNSNCNPKKAFESSAVRNFIGNGIIGKNKGYEEYCLSEKTVDKIEKISQNKNAVEVLKNKKIFLSNLTKLSYEKLDWILKLLENENFKNIILHSTKSKQDEEPELWLDMITNDGAYEDESEEEFQKHFDEFIATLNSEAATISISNFKTSVSDIKSLTYYSKEDLQEYTELIKTVAEKKQAILKNPQLYIDGDNEDGEFDNIQDETDEFFDEHKDKLIGFLKYSDKETFDALLRQRFYSAAETLNVFDSMGFANKKKLYNKLINKKDANGKPFAPNMKLQFVDIINAYVLNGGEEKLYEAAKQDRIDVSELNQHLFKRFMTNIGISEEATSAIPPEKMAMWDMKNIHLLSKEVHSGDYDEERILRHVIQTTCLQDFKTYIQNKSNNYGKTNFKTQKEFNRMGIDYDLWINPPSSVNVQFRATDKNMDKLLQISEQVSEDMEALRKTPLKGIVDKRFKKETEKGEFKLPDKCINNKEEMTKFIQNIIEQLNDVWMRAKSNVNDPKRSNFAKNTLTILDHLNQRIKDIDTISERKISKPVDLTIKMWDRNPAHDIFQGNYSTCCIGMGGGNGSAMPHYLTNTVFNMIEFVDNKTNEVMGNSLCYFAKDENDELVFVLDNVEINNSKKLSNAAGTQLRESIVEYASNLTKALTGRDDIKIRMGTSYNDIPTGGLKTEKSNLKLIGETDCESNYLDLYGGWVTEEAMTKPTRAYKLKD